MEFPLTLARRAYRRLDIILLRGKADPVRQYQVAVRETIAGASDGSFQMADFRPPVPPPGLNDR